MVRQPVLGDVFCRTAIDWLALVRPTAREAVAALGKKRVWDLAQASTACPFDEMRHLRARGEKKLALHALPGMLFGPLLSVISF